MSLVMTLMVSFSFSQGVVWYKGSFEEIKAKAKSENKAIFVDIYTTW